MPRSRWPELDAWLKAQGIRVGTPTLGQTTGGTHAPGSYHYLGQARDYGLYNCDCVAIARAFTPLADAGILAELIWTPKDGPGTYFKNGNRYTPTLKLANGHRDHVHAAITANGHLPAAPEDDVTNQDKEDIANLVLKKLAFGSQAHTNLGDVVNEVVKQVVAALK